MYTLQFMLWMSLFKDFFSIIIEAFYLKRADGTELDT